MKNSHAINFHKIMFSIIFLIISISKVYSAENVDFSEQEKKMFLEITESVPKKKLTSISSKWTHPKIYWIDNHRLIQTARSLPSGWHASDAEPSKIVIVDVDTGGIEELPYRGDLECYSEDRMIIRVYPDKKNQFFRGPPNHGEIILSGKLGSELK